MMKSPEKGQKPEFGQVFDDLKVKYLQIANFSEKQVSFKLKVIFSTNFRPKTKRIVKAVFEKNTKVSDFGLIRRPFRKYLQIKNFFKNQTRSIFYLDSSLTSCKKPEKFLQPFLRKLRYQPTNYYQQHQSSRTSLTPVQLIQTILPEQTVLCSQLNLI